MNAAKVILEGLFWWEWLIDDNPVYTFVTPDGTTVYVHNSLLKHKAEELLIKRYTSVHVAAEKAAEFLNGKGWSIKHHRDGGWFLERGPEGLVKLPRQLSDLDLIAEAVKAGWEG